LFDRFGAPGKDTGLEKILKDKGITTVIAVGTEATAPCFTPRALRRCGVLM
jgi:nicotinamidase-related amidase